MIVHSAYALPQPPAAVNINHRQSAPQNPRSDGARHGWERRKAGTIAEMDDAIAELWLLKSVEEIARELGVTEQFIRNRAKAIDLPGRRSFCVVR